jgi:small subunit ribosomal protein S9
VSDAEHPEDEHRPEDLEAVAESIPAETAEEPVQDASEEPVAAPAEEPVEDPVIEAADAPVAEPVAEAADAPVAEPVAEAADVPEPVADGPGPPAEPVATPEPVADAPEAPTDSATTATPAAAAAAGQTATGQTAAEPEEDEDVEVAPRQRPEIPGADLVPDIVSEADDFLDAEARAAAEAEAEAAAAREQEDDSTADSQPIADAAIDLAAGARYTATGKRKTAVARVILKPGTGTYSINGKTLDVFFPRETLQRVIRQPLEAVGYESRMDVVARMHGGGVAAQAGALRHGISRALLEADPNLRGELKRRGFLTRDPRVKERKKAGLKKARKRPQFSKR